MPYSKRKIQQSYQKNWYRKNRETIRIVAKKKRELNKEIINKRQRELYHSNDDKRREILEKQKIYNVRNKKKIKEYAAEYYQKNRVRILERSYRRNREKYGITLEQYHQMVSDQKGGCAICPNLLEDPKIGGGPCIDHSHSTGKVRGILCGSCNKGLGLFKDNPELLEKAARYLRKSST